MNYAERNCFITIEKMDYAANKEDLEIVKLFKLLHCNQKDRITKVVTTLAIHREQKTGPWYQRCPTRGKYSTSLVEMT